MKYFPISGPISSFGNWSQYAKAVSGPSCFGKPHGFQNVELFHASMIRHGPFVTVFVTVWHKKDLPVWKGPCKVNVNIGAERGT